jgi:hypothetical protein
MTLSKDSFFKKIDGLIRNAGYASIFVKRDAYGPSCAYTVGLTETYGCAELLIFGVNEEVANYVFHSAINRIKGGVRFADGDLLVDVLTIPCVIREISSAAACPFALNVQDRYEGTAHAALFQQIVYPDEASIFPWEPGYNERMRKVQTELWPPAN